tara:strand:- start:326 stop:835 length:510 start_codon:yes stop_codon:yes gene_type:complete
LAAAGPAVPRVAPKTLRSNPRDVSSDAKRVVFLVSYFGVVFRVSYFGVVFQKSYFASYFGVVFWGRRISDSYFASYFGVVFRVVFRCRILGVSYFGFVFRVVFLGRRISFSYSCVVFVCRIFVFFFVVFSREKSLRDKSLLLRPKKKYENKIRRFPEKNPTYEPAPGRR